MNKIRTNIVLEEYDGARREIIIDEKKLFDKASNLHHDDYFEYCGDTDVQQKIYCAFDYLYGIDMRPDLCKIARISTDSDWKELGEALEKFYWSYMNKKGVTILENE